MAVTVDNVAKIGLTLDTANIFKQIDNIQKKLNKLSVKNIKASRGEQVFDGIAKGAKKATEEAKTLQQAVREAENALSKAYYKNNTNPIWAQSEEAKKLVENVRKAKTALNDYNNVLKAVNEQVTGTKLAQVQNKDYQRQQREASAERKAILKQEQQEEKARVDEQKREYKQMEQEATRAWKRMRASEGREAKRAWQEIIEQDKLDSRSLIQQINDLKKHIESMYAKDPNYSLKDNGLFSDGRSQFDRDREKLDLLIRTENQFRREMQRGNISRLRYTDEFPSYQSEINFMRKEIQAKMRNVPNYIGSDDYKADIAYVQQLRRELSKLNADLKGVVEEKQKINQTKIKTDDIDNFSKRIRALRNELEKKALKDDSFIGSEDYNKKVAEIKAMQSSYNRIKNDIKEAKEQAKGFKNYQTEMARVEREAAKVYHEFANTKITDSKYGDLKKQLQDLSNEYQKLNRESVNFRKTIGISSSRGFYDLNSTYDYFLAKFRSKVTAGIAGIVEGYAMNAIPNFVDTMSNYQQNRVNFAQVLPDNVANDQNAMNQAMRDFSQIASDYGASVQEVTEAGRLWGRQYKDVAIIQELVRNSTKLSITDDMSLVEVNKGLEATMQQYNIQLKNANEAQEVSGKIVDSWAKLADNAVVTASDLAKANEQSAGAAYQSGVGFDYLNAMIATMSSATGKAGAEIGRSIRSMLVSMNSSKAQKEFQKLGIATKELGTDGVMHVRSYEKVITELMQKLKSSPNDVSNVVLAMSGGRRICPLLWEHRSNKRFYIG